MSLTKNYERNEMMENIFTRLVVENLKTARGMDPSVTKQNWLNALEEIAISVDAWEEYLAKIRDNDVRWKRTFRSIVKEDVLV